MNPHKNSLFIEGKDLNFNVFPDFMNEELDFLINFKEYEPNSHLISLEKTGLLSLSDRYFNIWDFRTLSDIIIEETIETRFEGILDFSLNFNQEAIMILTNNKEKSEIAVKGLVLRKLERKRALKLKKKSKEIETFTFSALRKEDESLNLSQFLINPQEKEKFRQYDLIFEVFFLYF